MWTRRRVLQATGAALFMGAYAVMCACIPKDARTAIAIGDAQTIDLRGMRAEPDALEVMCERVKNLTLRDCGALPDQAIPYADALTLRGAAVT